MDVLRRLFPFLVLLTSPAFAADPRYSVEVLSLDSLERRVVFRSTLRLAAPSFTATGDAICFREENRLYRVTLEKAIEAVEVTNENVADCALAAASGSIAEGNLPKAGRKGVMWLPRLSPDRSQIAFIAWKGRGEHGRPRQGDYLLRTAPYAGGDARDLARFHGDDGVLGTAPWSPDGRKIVFVSMESEVSRKGD